MGAAINGVRRRNVLLSIPYNENFALWGHFGRKPTCIDGEPTHTTTRPTSQPTNRPTNQLTIRARTDQPPNHPTIQLANCQPTNQPAMETIQDPGRPAGQCCWAATCLDGPLFARLKLLIVALLEGQCYCDGWCMLILMIVLLSLMLQPTAESLRSPNISNVLYILGSWPRVHF